MNNSIIKWIFVPITIILIIITLIGVSMLSAQNNQLEQADQRISSLEEQLASATQQIGSLQSNIAEVDSLKSSIDALEETIQNLDGQTGTGTALTDIAGVVKDVRTGVVAINTTTVYTYGWGSFTYDYEVEGAGSGWIIDESGIIVTNYHVIKDVDAIKVKLDNGNIYDVDLETVYYNELADIAIFKIEADNLSALKIGNASALAVGDWVVAMGNSLDMGVSAKEGIVSQLHVSVAVGGQSLDELIETSAAINSGNSGGVLVNMNGEVIGITNAKISAVGVEGMGYAININFAMSIINELSAQMTAD